MMPPNSYKMGYSADVRINLILDGDVLKVGQLGPDFLTLRDPVEHPPADAELVMSIDGNERRWNVHLPDGISACRPRTMIA